MNPVQVYVSLGSNIQPVSNIKACLQALAAEFGALKCSTVYRTAAVGFSGPDFLNAVVGFQTTQSLADLKLWFRQLETSQGRERIEQPGWHARTLDVDLLLYADTIDVAHKLPHGDILKYAFVLYPLADIAPDDLHPVLNKTFRQMAAESTLDRSSLEAIDLAAASD